MYKTNIYRIIFPVICICTTILAAKHSSPGAQNHYWNGLNPFFQPAHTLNYYGSGDVDNNSSIDSKDLDSLESLAASHAATNCRADVNGDGSISDEDVTLLKTHLKSGTALPSHWNDLTKDERTTWLKRCLAIDKTSSIPSSEDHFVCYHFASQFYLNFSYYGENLAHTIYTAAGTIFNLPVYSVLIRDHELNAILIGDNPLEFSDWYFIEPQNFRFVDPVAAGEGLSLNILTYSTMTGKYTSNIIEATRSETGWTVTKTAAGLVKNRPQPPVETGYSDMIPSWNPRVIHRKTSTPMLLFERRNDHLSTGTSIYMASIVNGGIAEEMPIVSDTMSARLLDASCSPDGKVHILWRGTRNYTAALFTGVIDPDKKNVENIMAFTESRIAKAGAISIAPEGSRYIFWLTDEAKTPDNPLLQGINGSTVVNGNWSSPQSIDSFDGLFYFSSWSQHILCNYVMSTVAAKGKAVVLSVPQPWQQNTSGIHLRFSLSEGWKDYPLANDSLVSGARMAIDSSNTIHCIYWATYDDTIRYPAGKVIYRSFSNSSWSPPVILDSSANNRCTDITVNERNDLLAVWEKDISQGTTVFCTQVCNQGKWLQAETHFAPENENVWYPRITSLRDTNFIVSWESRGTTATRVRCKQLSYSPDNTQLSRLKSAPVLPGKLCSRFSGNHLLVTVNNTATLPGIITVFDIQGKVLHKSFYADVRRCQIDMRSAGQGCRFVTVVCDNVKYTAKINMISTHSTKSNWGIN